MLVLLPNEFLTTKRVRRVLSIAGARVRKKAPLSLGWNPKKTFSTCLIILRTAEAARVYTKTPMPVE